MYVVGLVLVFFIPYQILYVLLKNSLEWWVGIIPAFLPTYIYPRKIPIHPLSSQIHIRLEKWHGLHEKFNLQKSSPFLLKLCVSLLSNNIYVVDTFCHRQKWKITKNVFLGANNTFWHRNHTLFLLVYRKSNKRKGSYCTKEKAHFYHHNNSTKCVKVSFISVNSACCHDIL